MYAHCPKALAEEKGITLKDWVAAINSMVGVC
jgi:hypothetical protein